MCSGKARNASEFSSSMPCYSDSCIVQNSLTSGPSLLTDEMALNEIELLTSTIKVLKFCCLFFIVYFFMLFSQLLVPRFARIFPEIYFVQKISFIIFWDNGTLDCPPKYSVFYLKFFLNYLYKNIFMRILFLIFGILA